MFSGVLQPPVKRISARGSNGFFTLKIVADPFLSAGNSNFFIEQCAVFGGGADCNLPVLHEGEDQSTKYAATSIEREDIGHSSPVT